MNKDQWMRNKHFQEMPERGLKPTPRSATGQKNLFQNYKGMLRVHGLHFRATTINITQISIIKKINTTRVYYQKCDTKNTF